MKEEIIPDVSNKFFIHPRSEPAMLTACMTSAVIPWGKGLMIDGNFYPLQATDVNIGILYISVLYRSVSMES
jgi:NADH-quinone oxidoreductase subunit H